MDRPPPPEEQLADFARGAVDLVRREELLDKLRRGKPLVVKAGFDPSSPDIHLGHTVVMRKMRQFQDHGHQAVFVCGDFTARIGDPSGRSRTRPALSAEEVNRNAATYRQQAFKLLDPERTRFVFNSSWLGELGSEGWLRLAGKVTVARMLERDDFSKRYRAGLPISLHEFLYPLAQAYDSVVLEADVELGGTDQTFNLLVGRDLMREFRLEPQVVLTTPLLVGLDGSEKMSKSLGNYIGIDEPPDEIYGKAMSLSDSLMETYAEVLYGPGALGDEAHPMRRKQALARHLVADFHGAGDAERAEQAFVRVFRDRRGPEERPEHALPARPEPVRLANLLVEAGVVGSTSDARRLIAGGAVELDGSRASDVQQALAAPAGRCYDLKVGKHRFVRVRFF